MAVIHRFSGRADHPEWSGVGATRYDESGSAGATRRLLIGPEDGADRFALRYFEIPAGGASSLDRHPHDHGVYVLTGRADLHLSAETQSVGPGDVIYIAPNEPHQFRTTSEGPFGFLCIRSPAA